MNGWVGGWMDTWMNNGWMHGWVGRYGQAGRRMIGWMGE